MSVSTYLSDVKRHRREIEKQQANRAAADKKVADADAAALKLEQDAARTKQASTRSSKLSRAASKRTEANKARDASAKASKALADAQKKLFESERKLADAQAKEQSRQAAKDQRQRERDEHRRAAQERRQRERAERERAAATSANEAELAVLRAQQASLTARIDAEPWATAPKQISVLFVAASPDGQHPLRLDREVGHIQRRFRETKERDSIRFSWRLAARSAELVQYLNEDEPDIVHFSGHSDAHGLAFEDANGRTKVLDAAQLSNLLTISSDHIRLAVFNSCDSSSHAEAACEFIDAAIGMEQSITDSSATIFAAQFYNPLGFGHSLRKAFDQARVQVEIETGALSGNPQLFVAPGLAADEIYLVAPPAS